MERGHKIPKHVAIVMDGNGRWAERRGRPRIFGHIRGSARVKKIVREADRLGIQALTLYTFSTENWSRPSFELSVLWRLFKKYLVREISELHKNNVQLRVIGETEKLDPAIQELIKTATGHLAQNTGLKLTLCVSYGGRRELVLATKHFAQDCLRGLQKPEALTEALMSQYLWTAPLTEATDVDLVIRTGGEKRISNFLLWQAAYAEYYFTDIFWPDFEPRHLQDALNDFSSRERRFGGVRGQAGSFDAQAEVIDSTS